MVLFDRYPFWLVAAAGFAAGFPGFYAILVTLGL
jgi:hypothetical protein